MVLTPAEPRYAQPMHPGRTEAYRKMAEAAAAKLAEGTLGKEGKPSIEPEQVDERHYAEVRIGEIGWTGESQVLRRFGFRTAQMLERIQAEVVPEADDIGMSDTSGALFYFDKYLARLDEYFKDDANDGEEGEIDSGTEAGDGTASSMLINRDTFDPQEFTVTEQEKQAVIRKAENFLASCEEITNSESEQGSLFNLVINMYNKDGSGRDISEIDPKELRINDQAREYLHILSEAEVDVRLYLGYLKSSVISRMATEEGIRRSNIERLEKIINMAELTLHEAQNFIEDIYGRKTA
ncbi:MAG: hypothetical protein V1898_04580 [Patescibacteria group bacterium]